MQNKDQHKKQSLIELFLLIAILVFVNIIASKIYWRFDLTKEKKYTLSDATKNYLNQLDDIVYVKVYLEGEGFPAGFKKLRNSVEEMLNEFKSLAGNKIEYEFIDPFANTNPRQSKEIYDQLLKKGLRPTNLKVKEDDNYSERKVFPGVIISYRGLEKAVSILQNQISLSPQEILNNSESLLEYTLINTIKQLSQIAKPKIGFIQGHGELDHYSTLDIKHTLRENYRVDSIFLPNELAISKNYDGIIIAKPTHAFNEREKFKIDQYIMNGGKVLWLIDNVHAEMQMMTKEKAFMANDAQLNLEDMLFQYGVRINADLIQDLQAAPIPLVVGAQAQTKLLPWYYFPVIFSTNKHPIVNNLDAIMCTFVNSIDTVGAKGIKKTILLHSSQYSKALMAPVRVNLQILANKPDPQRYKQANLPVAVLLEGNFTSIFKNRLSTMTKKMIDSLDEVSYKSHGDSTSMIIISDGDVIRNDFDRSGLPYPLGFYKYTQQTFDNKNLILNAIEFLCDKSNLIETRSREVKLRLLDKQRIKDEKKDWQIINLVLPLVLIALFGFIFNYIRKRKYAY